MRSSSQGFDPFRSLEWLGLGAVLLTLITFFGLATDHFFSPTTARTLANQLPDAILISVGMTLVLIVGGIDLSVGSVLGLSAAVLGYTLGTGHLPVVLAVGVSMLAGGVCGLLNGLTVVRWSLPGFIVTLGMLEAARGGTYLVSGSRTAYVAPRVEWLADTTLGGFSLPILVALLTVVAAQVLLTRTVLGRYMVAIGTNEEAARLSGINPSPVKVIVYSLSGLLAGAAGVSNVCRLGAADPNAGTGHELNAIAAVVIGGTSLMGGRGSVFNSLFGVLIIAVLEAGLAQMGVQEPSKRLITGCVIVGAVILDYYRTRLGGARTRVGQPSNRR